MRSLIERVAIGFMMLFVWNAITGYALMWLIGKVHHLSAEEETSRLSAEHGLSNPTA